MFSQYERPEGSPLLVMYNSDKDQLGISAEGWDLVAIINFVPFVKYIPDREDYEEYYGNDRSEMFGYMPLEGVVFKTDAWDVIGEF